MLPEDFHIRLTRFCQNCAAQWPIVYRNVVRLLLFVGNLLLVALSSVLLLPSLWLIHHVSNDAYPAYWLPLFLLSLACLMVLSGILRAVPVVKAPPAGIRLKVHDAPELFAMLDEESRRAGCWLRIRHVWIDDEYGLYSSQRRLFGFPVRHNLHIGLPLLQTIDQQHFRILLAYQAAHLSAGYTGSNDEFSHHRQRWQQIAALQSQYGLLNHLLSPFYRGFVPFFETFMHALSRQQVLFSDQLAARHFEPQQYAQAMSQLHAYGYHFDMVDWWSDYWQQADEMPQPARLPYTAFPEIWAQYPHHAANLRKLLSEPPYTNDTHPTLDWRLHILNVRGQLPPHDKQEKAIDLLGKSAKIIIQTTDNIWWKKNRTTWQERFDEASALREELAQLDENAAHLTVDAALKRAWLTEWLKKQPETAFAQLQALYQAHPDHPVVLFAYARQLLKHNQNDGVALMTRANELDPDSHTSAMEVLADYHRRNGRDAAADYFEQAFNQGREIDNLAQIEAENWQVDDPLLPPDLDDPKLQSWLADLTQTIDLSELYLAKRKFRYHPHRVFYVLGYRFQTQLNRHQLNENQKKMKQFITEHFAPYPCLFIDFKKNRAYRRALQSVPRSKLL